MKELDYIRKVENGVNRQIELARKMGERKTSRVRAEKDKLIQERLDGARKKLEDAAGKARKEAEERASKILKSSAARLGNIQDEADRNFDDAVKLILRYMGV